MTFKSVVSAVSEQCQEIKQALELFSYFECWDPDTVAECCRLASVLQFPPDALISGSETADTYMVYFVLEGTCKMVRCLQVKSTWETKKKRPPFFDDGRAQYSESAENNFASLLFRRELGFQEGSGLKMEIVQSSNRSEGSDTDHLRNPSEYAKPKEVEFARRRFPVSPERELECPENNTKASKSINKREEQNSTKNKCDEGDVEERGKPKETTVIHAAKKNTELQAESCTTTATESELNLKVLEQCKKKWKEGVVSYSKGCWAAENPEKEIKVFVQAGLLYKGACVGLSEVFPISLVKSGRESFVMSSTKVRCLRIPLRFLLQNNHGNIWNRIRLFHSLYLPNDEAILSCLEASHKWTNWKRKQTEKIFYSKKIPIYTSVADVPFSIRMMETESKTTE